MAHIHLVSTITEVKKLRSFLKQSKQSQIRSNIERNHIRAVIFSWYKNHRKELIRVIPENQLSEVDKIFKEVLELSEKQPSRQKINDLLKKLSNNLIKTQGSVLTAPTDNSQSIIPIFSELITNDEMRDILKRRWGEVEKCLLAGASLSATVMMGGILEGLLMAKVNAFSNASKLFKCNSIPLDSKTKKKIPLNKWTLKTYIEVAYEMGWIGKVAKRVGVVLRDYRNYIHPQKELTHGIHISSEDARIFWSITSVLANELLQHRA